MTKQEHIEEMISAMAASNNPFVDVPIEIMPKVAEALYNAGYRKVSADTLILTENQLKKIIEEEYKKALKSKKENNMGSEKVKEIKKALEDNANYEHHNKLGYIDGYKCKTVAYADILTLINELESENKRLNKAINSVQKGFDNGEFISKDCQTKTLKQFAERLKEQMNVREYMGVKYKQGVFSENDIDETLKEYEE